METVNLLDPISLLVFSIVLFLIIFIRYLVIAGSYHYIFYSLFRKSFKHRILDTSPFKKKQLLKEIYCKTAPVPIKRGDVLIKDFDGTGIDVIMTKDVLL